MSIRPSKVLLIVFLLIICVTLSACPAVPLIQSFKDIGATESDRQTLLANEVKEFNISRYWGSSDALTRVTPDAQDLVRSEILRAKRSKERIVESNVEFMNFEEDAYKATVDLAVRYFSVPSYIVHERYERQHWVFSISEGWKMNNLQVNPDENNV
ncbi:MAG: hypothetical protein KDD56_07465 [Bdellovibrionales bacterium]|nr:hypothetical protein [Bdellovibrionales bacterium]